MTDEEIRQALARQLQVHDQGMAHPQAQIRRISERSGSQVGQTSP